VRSYESANGMEPLMIPKIVKHYTARIPAR
jgi:hypothetical protein